MSGMTDQMPWEGREQLPEDVRIALDHVNAAANAARHAGDYKRANALVASRVTLAKAARLRESQPKDGEGQAVAWRIEQPDGAVSVVLSSAISGQDRGALESGGARVRPLVYGDSAASEGALQAIIERWQPHGRVPVCELEAALSTQPEPDFASCGFCGSPVRPGDRCHTCGEISPKPAPSEQVAAPAPVAGEAVRDWPHIANEWADMATSSIDGLKNIRDGISTVDEVLANAEQMLAHCREVNDAPALAQDRASQAGAAGVPEGWRLVPEMATDEMLSRGWAYGDRVDSSYDRQGAYADLIAAAPVSPAEREAP